MGRATLHARIEIGLATALLLGSCNNGSPLARDEIMDIADDAVDASGVSGRIEELEQRLSDVEAKAQLNQTNIDTLFSNAAADRDTANGNARMLNDFKDHTLDSLERVENRLGL